MRQFALLRIPSFTAGNRPSFVARRAVAALTLALVASSVLRVSVLHAQSPPSRAVVARVADSLAKAFLAANNSPSVAVAVVRGSDTLVMRAWGTADVEQDVDATPQTVYRIGSVTKQFTSATVMQLYE